MNLAELIGTAVIWLVGAYIALSILAAIIAALLVAFVDPRNDRLRYEARKAGKKWREPEWQQLAVGFSAVFLYPWMKLFELVFVR